jgi:hypothetical protein
VGGKEGATAYSARLPLPLLPFRYCLLREYNAAAANREPLTAVPDVFLLKSV